jgi:molybdopterin synthase catalytic subunit
MAVGALILSSSEQSRDHSDGISTEVSDLAAAQDMALQAIKDIREEAIQLGASWQGWRLDIVDRSGHVLFSTSLDPAFL